MAHVKTTARAYRLDCGCIHEFSSLPAVSTAVVVCNICESRTFIAFRYPDSCCAATCRTDKPGGGVVKVRCNLNRLHEGLHYDETVDIHYSLPGRIRSDRSRNRDA